MKTSKNTSFTDWTLQLKREDPDTFDALQHFDIAFPLYNLGASLETAREVGVLALRSVKSLREQLSPLPGVPGWLQSSGNTKGQVLLGLAKYKLIENQ